MFIKRLFAQCETKPPQNEEAWEVESNTLRINLDQVPELKAAGGAVRLELPNSKQRFLIVHGIDNQFYAYQNNCACGGFRVDPVPSEPLIRCCTLGRSTYNYSGERVSGPAEKNLITYPVKQSDQTLTIELPDSPAS